MPLQYRDGLRVSTSTRARTPDFDVSHMGQVRVTGPDLHATLERALPVDFDGWPVGAQRYSLLLNERGGIEDDLMVTRLSDEVRIVVNAAGRQKDLALLRALCPQLSFELLDRALIALQGPEAEAVFAPIEPGSRASRSCRPPHSAIGSFRARATPARTASRSRIPSAQAAPLAQASFKLKGKTVASLGARDTLRLEAGCISMDRTWTPTLPPWKRASAGRLPVAPRRRQKEGGFPGADVYLRQTREGANRRLVGLIGDEPVPIRHGATLVDPKNKEVGIVTSGTVSPSTQRAIMLGYVKSSSENLFAACATPTGARLQAVRAEALQEVNYAWAERRSCWRRRRARAGSARAACCRCW